MGAAAKRPQRVENDRDANAFLCKHDRRGGGHKPGGIAEVTATAQLLMAGVRAKVWPGGLALQCLDVAGEFENKLPGNDLAAAGSINC